MNRRFQILFVATALAICRPTVAVELYDQQIRLLNDDGSPMAEIPVRASAVVGWKPGRDFGEDVTENVDFVTDKNGVGSVRITSANGIVNFTIAQSPTIYGMRWKTKASRQPTTPIVIYGKAPANPVPMFIRKIGPGFPYWDLVLPSREAPCSFDLLKGDWLPPYGKGETADLIFRWIQRGTFRNLSEPFDATLNIAFTGQASGIVPATSKEPGPTTMPLPRYAPSEGYLSSIDLRMWRESGKPVQTNFPNLDDKNSGYFFRFRTIVDASGKVVTARYGKFVGGIEFRPLEKGRTPLSFWYFVGGTENDRNMENRLDDNLFGDSDSAGRRRR